MKIAYVFFMILAAALIGPAAGFNISQTADENTLLVDGHFFGVLSYDVDDMGYITLILEPLELDDTAFYPPEEDPANDPRIGPNETFLYKKPGFLVTIETGFDPEYDAEIKKEAAERAEREKALKQEPDSTTKEEPVTDEHTHHRDGTARSAHRTKTSTSHLSDASFGDEVGSRALQDAVVHSSILSLDPAICSTRSSITSRLRQGSASLRNPIASSRL